MTPHGSDFSFSFLSDCLHWLAFSQCRRASRRSIFYLLKTAVTLELSRKMLCLVQDLEETFLVSGTLEKVDTLALLHSRWYLPHTPSNCDRAIHQHCDKIYIASVAGPERRSVW